MIIVNQNWNLRRIGKSNWKSIISVSFITHLAFPNSWISQQNRNIQHVSAIVFDFFWIYYDLDDNFREENLNCLKFGGSGREFKEKRLIFFKLCGFRKELRK